MKYQGMGHLKSLHRALSDACIIGLPQLPEDVDVSIDYTIYISICKNMQN